MAIIRCPHCNKKTVDSTDLCLNCGKDINAAAQKKPGHKTGFILTVIITVVAGGCIFILVTPDIKNKLLNEVKNVFNDTKSSLHDEQQVNAAAKNPAAAAVGADISLSNIAERNADTDYSKLWNRDISYITGSWGVPDINEDNCILYKNILFGTYNSSVMYQFENNRLNSVVVTCEETADKNNIRSVLTKRFGTAVSSYNDTVFWETSDTAVSFKISDNSFIITYQKNF